MNLSRKWKQHYTLLQFAKQRLKELLQFFLKVWKHINWKLSICCYLRNCVSEQHHTLYVKSSFSALILSSNMYSRQCSRNLLVNCSSFCLLYFMFVYTLVILTELLCTNTLYLLVFLLLLFTTICWMQSEQLQTQRILQQRVISNLIYSGFLTALCSSFDSFWIFGSKMSLDWSSWCQISSQSTGA